MPPIQPTNHPTAESDSLRAIKPAPLERQVIGHRPGRLGPPTASAAPSLSCPNAARRFPRRQDTARSRARAVRLARRGSRPAPCAGAPTRRQEPHPGHHRRVAPRPREPGDRERVPCRARSTPRAAQAGPGCGHCAQTSASIKTGRCRAAHAKTTRALHPGWASPPPRTPLKKRCSVHGTSRAIAAPAKAAGAKRDGTGRGVALSPRLALGHRWVPRLVRLVCPRESGTSQKCSHRHSRSLRSQRLGCIFASFGLRVALVLGHRFICYARLRSKTISVPIRRAAIHRALRALTPKPDVPRNPRGPHTGAGKPNSTNLGGVLLCFPAKRKRDTARAKWHNP